MFDQIRWRALWRARYVPARQEVGHLIWPGGLSEIVETRRAALVLSRLRGAALVLGPLFILGIAGDAALMPGGLWLPLAAGRVVAALACLAFALAARGTPTMRRAGIGVVVLLAIPTLFYYYASGVLPNAGLERGAAAMLVTYELIPVLVAGAVALFPLTMAESAVAVLPVAAGKLIGTFSGIETESWFEQAGVTGILLVLWFIAATAAACQLRFMVALLHQSSRDALTGVFTRGIGEELLAMHFDESERSGRPLTVVFLDLDGFKRVNDHFGHEAGDDVLEQAARTLRHNVRGGDAVIRWGGDEFLLLLPAATYEAGETVVDRLGPDSIAVCPDNSDQQASTGIAERRRDGAEDWTSLVRIADERAYIAKAERKGRAMQTS